jgi:hypothetical protein
MAASAGLWVKTAAGTGQKLKFINAQFLATKEKKGELVHKGKYFAKPALPATLPADDNGLAYVSPAAHKELAKLENKIRNNQKFETAFVVDAVGNVLLTKTGTGHSVHFYPPEFKLLKDTIMTHNHPGGSSFSGEDISMAMGAKLREMRAVGMTWEGKPVTYSMRPDAKGWKGVALHSTEVVQAYKKVGHEFDLTHSMTKLGWNPERFIQERQHTVWETVAKQYGFTYTRAIG